MARRKALYSLADETRTALAQLQALGYAASASAAVDRAVAEALRSLQHPSDAEPGVAGNYRGAAWQRSGAAKRGVDRSQRRRRRRLAAGRLADGDAEWTGRHCRL
jgi:hypothetical protein